MVQLIESSICYQHTITILCIFFICLSQKLFVLAKSRALGLKSRLHNFCLPEKKLQTYLGSFTDAVERSMPSDAVHPFCNIIWSFTGILFLIGRYYRFI